ncbi:MAG: isocitrate lyase/phosphoenolpyruvate mutase family protein, partial [Pseudomonadota bacterium]
FADAGADVIYAPGLPDLDAVRAVCAIGQPVNVLMGGSGPASATADLAAAGVARISVGSAFARLAYGGVIRAAEQIRDDGDFGALQDAAGFAEIEALLPPR